MRRFYDDQCEEGYDVALFGHLQRILFAKAKVRVPRDPASAPQPGVDVSEEEIEVCASAEATSLAIMSLLQRRQAFLETKGITDPNYLFTDADRKECMAQYTAEYEGEP